MEGKIRTANGENSGFLKENNHLMWKTRLDQR